MVNDFLATYTNMFLIVGLIALMGILISYKYRKSLRFIIFSRLTLAGVIAAILTKIVVTYNGKPEYGMVASIVGIIAIAAIVVVGRRMFNNIIQPIETLTTNAAKMAVGDYSVSINLNNKTEEFRQLSIVLGDMIEKINVQMKRNKKMAEQLASAATDLSASSEEVASSSSNIASSQQQISKGANNQVTQISDIQKQFSDLTKGIRDVKQNVVQISEITTIITNLANQTNMLALNAAIEAARAGEAGRGFNVVADQVRKLAESSRESVKKTETMIDQIKNITEKEEEKIALLVKAFDNIAAVAEETSASTEESAAAAEEESASMESITTTAQNLQKLADELKKEFDYIHFEQN